MKKPGYIDQLVGALFIILSLYFVSAAGNDPTPVDEFNIYWMFTISAMGLGGFLVVTNSENKIIYWGTRAVLLFSVLFPLYIVFAFDTEEHPIGAAFYFPWVFILFGLFVFARSAYISKLKSAYFASDANPERTWFGVDHKRSVVFIARIFVGSLFIVSGLIKANDPLGFSYKLEEYFTKEALGYSALGDFWVFFYDWSLFLAVFIASVEVLLGLAVLFGGKAKLAAWTLLSMALFFAWLTWFTADCLDQQTAFGDMHITESKKIDEKYNPQYDKIAKDYEGYYEYINESDDNFSLEELVVINECRSKVSKVDSLKSIDEKAMGEWTRTCVDDCGCFGDAMKGSVGRSLTPWESFYKDVCLLFFVIVLLVHSGEIKLNSVRDDMAILPVALLIIGLFSGGLFGWYFPLTFTLIAMLIFLVLKKYPVPKIGAEWTIAIVMFLFSLGFTLYCLWYLPIKDFRPYAIGNNLIEEKTSIQPELKFYYVLKNKTTGEEAEFDHWPDNWENEYDYVSSRNVVVKEGKTAPAADFSISYRTPNDDLVDITDSILNMENVFLLVAYDLSHTNGEALKLADEFAKQSQNEGVAFICLTSSSQKQQDSVRNELKIDLQFYAADEKVQKTIVRSNPGLLLIKKAVVTAKWAAASFPEFEAVKNEYLK